MRHTRNWWWLLFVLLVLPTVTQCARKPRAVPPPVTKRIAVILFAPIDGAKWITEAQVRTALFTHPKSSANFYKEQSYGRLLLGGSIRPDGDVFGWYDVPFTDQNNCGIVTWAGNAATQAQRDGFNRRNYDAIVYVSSSTAGCGNRAFALSQAIYISKGFNSQTLSHELGHTFGLAHAKKLKCTTRVIAVGPPAKSTVVQVPMSESCAESEYGDFATMGATTYYHMNAPYKDALGFFDASNIRDVTEDGVYPLRPLEVNTSEVQTLRVVRSEYAPGYVDEWYWVEFRQPSLFDAWKPTDIYVNSIGIRAGNPSTSRVVDVNAAPVRDPLRKDPMLAVGQTFNDDYRQVSFTLERITEGVAWVRVHFHRTPPTDPPPQPPRFDLGRDPTDPPDLDAFEDGATTDDLDARP
jgi:hypothetical protein